MLSNIDESLVYMRDNLLHTFVNLILIARISTGLEYIAVAPQCKPFTNAKCPCMFEDVEMSDRVVELFDQRLTELVDSRKYDISNEFTVVVQPYLSNAQPVQDENGIVDVSYIAADCIHLTASGNRVYATGLWMNMFQPVGSKSVNFTGDLPPICPPEDSPYFSTYLNSAGNINNTLYAAIALMPSSTHTHCHWVEPHVYTRTSIYSNASTRPVPGLPP